MVVSSAECEDVQIIQAEKKRYDIIRFYKEKTLIKILKAGSGQQHQISHFHSLSISIGLFCTVREMWLLQCLKKQTISLFIYPFRYISFKEENIET